MTHAVCFNCGNFKFGVLVQCKSCGMSPREKMDYAYSYCFSDHFLSYEELESISKSMLAGNPRPVMSEEDERSLIEAFAPQRSKA